MGERISETSDRSDTSESSGPLSTNQHVDQESPHERVEQLIDELRKRTSELEQANRELRRVSHYRSLFLARMSHELRTPLTSILGFSEILLDHEQLTETQRRFCQKVQDSGFQLQASLNQLVALSRIEAGETEVFLQGQKCFFCAGRDRKKLFFRKENKIGDFNLKTVFDQCIFREIFPQ